MPDLVHTFDPGDTSDRTVVVTAVPTELEIRGGGSHYRADDPTFAGALHTGGARFTVTNPPLAVGDVLTVRLGGPGRAGVGGYNGGGSSTSATLTNYGLGGAGATEVWRNGILWLVAGGAPGGFRYEPPFDVAVILDPWYDLPLYRTTATPAPGPTEAPRIPLGLPETIEPAPYLLTDDESPGPHVDGLPGGEHDGADGVLGQGGFTTGGGGGGLGGGASGPSGYYLTSNPGYPADFFVWAQGRFGGSLIPGGLDVGELTGEGDVGYFRLSTPAGPGSRWHVRRHGM